MSLAPKTSRTKDTRGTLSQNCPKKFHLNTEPRHKCRSILFVTGAGISSDSGLPTYRGIGGLYDVEATEEGLPIEEILSEPMMRSNPRLTWKYLVHIADAARGATYNRAHEVIAEMERHFPRVWTLTQNIDGFHRLAGSRNVIEIHGNMRSLSCTKCPFRQTVDDSTRLEIPPRCPDCDAVLRPDVVLFEETLPEEAVRRLRREWDVGFGAVFSVGTSSVFPYIQEPMVAARRMGVPTVEINPSETVVSAYADYRLPLGAAQALHEIWIRYSETD
ncbi:MAG: NAD-dependent protein deacylase [Rhodopirellula sp.]|nr:NAD-dependent protein deacylase [Rhodopirellula sp.]